MNDEYNLFSFFLPGVDEEDLDRWGLGRKKQRGKEKINKQRIKLFPFHRKSQ